MRSTTRAQVATRMALEIHEHLARTLTPGIGALEETWERMREPDERMMAAVRGWEEGTVTYTELEAEGARYVEAWMGVDGAWRGERERAA